ncbi:hypothetical protein [Fodinibius sp.]|uniref:hypothetical protein n=1 Tax=Fodinibius sp. TaxID=1872440 RepID=UPI002ACE7B0E|nr:hypothetical protein [Fodinibius sp.]MDZ7659659.1 hypothetical protein [Fodinibius sp.]
MVKTIIIIILILHGLIHFLGFVKAFELAQIDQLKEQISNKAGTFWLLTAFIFFVTAILLYFGNESWRMAGGAAVIISQILIILSWSDAKYGTIANVVVAVAISLEFGN